MSHLKERVESIRTRIDQAISRSGGKSQGVTLVAATKMVAPEIILEAGQCGVVDIGENRVQEANSKKTALSGQIAFRKHFIGQLQRNKARQAVELFDVIQSIDRVALAQAVNSAAHNAGKIQACLLEVKISADEAKSGIPLAQVRDFVDGFQQFEFLKLNGLMGIAPFDVSEEETRKSFRTLFALFSDLKTRFGEKPVLSMGMSDDFEMAIEEGSTMVRIGRALFGERYKT